MNRHGMDIKLFAGNSNRALAQEIANILGLPLGKSEITRFSDGETSVSLQESVRGCDVFIIQSTCSPVNENLMDLLIMIDAMKRSSAGRITAVMPYFGYARQDRKAKAHDPISAKLVADLLSAAGANRILTIDLHAAQIQGFFNIPVDHMLGAPVLVAHYMSRCFGGEDLVVVSPDLGSVGRARGFATRMGAPMAIIDKRRPRANVAEVMNIIGDVRGKRAILVDDLIDTAGTICKGAAALKAAGASQVFACCTHPVLSGQAMQLIAESPIEELVIMNTIPVDEHLEIKNTKLRVLSIAPLFAEAIERIYDELPVSSLYVDAPTKVKPIVVQQRMEEF